MNVENEKDLLNLVMTAPIGICVLDAATLVCEMVNDTFIKVAGKPYEAIYGQYHWDSFAEVAPFYEAKMEYVVKEGKPVYCEEEEMMLIRHGREETIFITFVYMPLKNKEGKVKKVAVWVLENTMRVKERRAVQELNEELTVANEELAASNDELVTTRNKLQEALTEAEINRARVYEMIQSSPVAILVQRGEDLVIEEFNQPFLEIIGRDSSIKGKPSLEVMPELVGSPVIELVYHTYRTGEEIKLTEVPITFNKYGKPYEGYFTVTYTALKENGQITGILQTGMEVTDQVHARSKAMQAEESLRAAIDAAQLGTFSVNTQTGELNAAARTKELFGFKPEDDITVAGCLNQVREDYRALVGSIFEKATTKGERAEVDFPVIGYHDGKLRWLRNVGQVQQISKHTGSIYTGVLLDITEQVQNEQRKNDFIGMVSHELKTPLTSMSGYLQILKINAKNNEESLTNVLAEKANKQVTKMTKLVNGFLNVSRLEAGKIYIEKSRFDMAELLKEAEHEAEAMITSHRLIFHPVEPTQVIADKDKIGQVINNLTVLTQ